MKVAIVNGPNLNLVGTREPDVYGTITFEKLLAHLKKEFPNVEVLYFQSNVEGELINFLHELREHGDLTGILINAGGYTHTSVALGDAVAAMNCDVIEVHLSNVFSREDFRHRSYVGRAASGSISGFGMDAYRLGVIRLTQPAAFG